METYPRYQDFKALLVSFELSLMGFLVGQIQYLQHKLDEEQPATPAKDTMTAPDVQMEDGDNGKTKFPDYTSLAGKARQDPTVFDFDGEYSMVADPAGGDVSKRIQDVRKAIEEVIGCELRSVHDLVVITIILMCISLFIALVAFLLPPKAELLAVSIAHTKLPYRNRLPRQKP